MITLDRMVANKSLDEMYKEDLNISEQIQRLLN